MAGGRPFTAPWEHFKIVNGTRHVKYKSAHCRYGNQLLTKLQPSRHLKKHITTCQRMPVDICEAYAGEDLLSKRLKNGKAAVPQPAGCEDARSRDMDNILLTPEDKKRFLMKTVMVFYTNCWAFRMCCDTKLAEILAQAQEVDTFVRNHTATNSRFAEAIRSPDNIDNRRSLKIPVDTRLYSHYECSKLVVESERIIRDLVSDDALLAKYNALKATSFKRIVLSEAFWIKGDMVLKLLSPIHKVFARFEKDSLSVRGMLRDPVYNDDIPGINKDMQARFRERIHARWEFIDSRPMRIAYLLDHRRDTMLFTTQQQNDSVADLQSLAARLRYTPTQVQALHKELGKFMVTNKKCGGGNKRSYHADSPIT
ncbi:Hypothetical protein PHPALM_19614 [Phytophthora palmivora]|uniref:Uncharacterized protein n=1 Tax=Phytophthora palmivora TaxID=4796 RepID=A0A2P4XGZ2_9STRA|nr:Hypothetical protein PHPALM_19614 [Phytophthora palmivora]